MSESKLPDWIVEHLELYNRTNGAEGHYMDFTHGGGKPNTPNLLLTTIGRKSGKAITLPLIYGPDGDRFVIVASKGGAPEHPAWYLNLMAQPEVQLQVGTRRLAARAYTASGEERKRLWELMTDIYAPYDEYQTKTTREIPVVVLEPGVER